MTPEDVHFSLSASQMAAMLDNAPIAIYVSDVENRELLYANDLAKKLFLPKAGGEPAACYHVAGFAQPCPFCQLGRMKHSEFLIRNYEHPRNGRLYQLSGKLIIWEGRPAHIEYILDITEEQKARDRAKAVEEELRETNEQMQNILNGIPGGVAIYKVSNQLETRYVSDGVLELTGYSAEEYQRFVQGDVADLIYEPDRPMVLAEAKGIAQTHQVATMEFRTQHRDGRLVWVRAQAKWIGDEDGCPLLHCVFHNITDLKKAQLEMDYLVNSIPGGIASFRIVGSRFLPTFCSDGVMALSGHTREEFRALVGNHALRAVYKADRKRMLLGVRSALESGGVLDIFFRIRHKNGNLIWIHLNGQRMDPLDSGTQFYAVFTGMSAETRLYQSIANDTADGIYVIEKGSYDLLYANESNVLFHANADHVGQKCYTAIHGKAAPCEFCTLKDHALDDKPHRMTIAGSDRYYSTRFRETEWNGIPAYIKYVRDVTDEVRVQQEKDHLEQYFQTVVNHLPVGIAVVRFVQDGSMIPEFLSGGFADMTGMTLDETWQLYREDAMAGVHPEDRGRLSRGMRAFVESDESHYESVYRLKHGSGGYVWVKNTLSILQSGGGVSRIYASYHDMTKEREEQEQLRQQFNDLILQHYRMPGPNAMIIGHCNITQNRILEIIDHTGFDLSQGVGTDREAFFIGISTFLPNKQERQAFLDTYLNAPALEAFRRGQTELAQTCFMKLPKEPCGHFVECKVNLVKAPDTDDITGILTVTDITERIISERILDRLSVAGYDLVVDVNLLTDQYTILAGDGANGDYPAQQGRHSVRIAHLLQDQILPKDRENTAKMLDPAYLQDRLQREESYSFPYSILDEGGEIRAKNMTISATELCLGRICLARTDITDSVREQQRLLNVIAYTFELLAYIHLDTDSLTLYTRQTVLENLPPLKANSYSESVGRFSQHFGQGSQKQSADQLFQLETLCRRLEEKPSGYDFVLPQRSGTALRYKQFSVMWGDASHTSVCMVRADVTDMLAAEHRAKAELETALSLAEEASRAKSDFLSSMSHDIRTPLNAIIGMTTLAINYLDDRGRVEDCLQKISLASKHLLSLINDILDMSKIERSQIALNRVKIFLPELLEQVSSMIAPQAKLAGLSFSLQSEIQHPVFYGDSLRINQILVNLLGNAVKFTPEGGSVSFEAKELSSDSEGCIRYRFIIRDTGIGMSESFLARLFEPFTRSRAVSRVEGTGLGLSITKGLVDLMKGEISVESQPGHGTTFCVILPCEAAQGSAGTQSLASPWPAEPPPLASLQGRQFLLAEDNAINAEILLELLEIYGAHCVLTTDGQQAVQAYADAAPNTYDAILMDIQMPVLNGYAATRAIRAMDRKDAKTIPIVAMTANAFAEDVQAAQEAGMSAHVAKPIDMQVLWSTLDSLLGRPGRP